MNKNIGKIPLILAIETSGRTGSAAIAAGEHLLSEKTFTTAVKHSAELFPAIGSLLSQFDKEPCQIDHIYISVGPGSFTGLRIAVTLAKIMQLANKNIKIVTVDSLDCIAANIKKFENRKEAPVNRIASIVDAKRGRFFIAVYKKKTQQARRPEFFESWDKELDDCLMTPQQFIEKFADSTNPIRLLGEGIVYYKDKFTSDGINFLSEEYWTPTAANIHLLGFELARKGLFAEPLSLVPRYIQQPDIKLKK